ncbi:AcrIIA2 family anti-CRISPR protein [Listeria monocytogenes]|uniref:AcrIIA2 family anti-CRISPR protein n=1 Tax=Listeria monocytogenes TaxID=1639 RepID=UPI0011EABFE8|nr:AcrIIA2 family anti-CRISPR protein [Listeria monocytogenes]EIZ6626551.1 AcrIIA2 family anti-CRISPR protein [Listeria monocytogenes]EKA5785935.1 AcrIIA2 family anti-CRISPR protein [Listeria monocytogenes]TYU52800.1 hypothetical protein FZ027_08385 [Listeria monocytogenes]TYV72840.1 hypothetical protein FZ077_05880 [Listeria monocytogenes]
MTLTTVQRKYNEAINEFEETIGKDVDRTPEIAQHILNDADYIAFTKTKEYALDLCTTDIEGYEDTDFLDESLLYSTFLETEDKKTYYIHFLQETEFSEDDNEEDLPLATKKQIEEYQNQAKQNNVILISELN